MTTIYKMAHHFRCASNIWRSWIDKFELNVSSTVGFRKLPVFMYERAISSKLQQIPTHTRTSRPLAVFHHSGRSVPWHQPASLTGFNKSLVCVNNCSMTQVRHSSKDTQISYVSSILKSPSQLLVKRPRKKVLKLYEEGKFLQVDNVVAYAVAEEIRLVDLRQYLRKQGLYNLGDLPQDETKAVHLYGKYNVDQKQKEIFVFQDGSVVFWRVPEIERGAFLKMLSKYWEAPYVSGLVLYEREELDVSNGPKTCLIGDTIHLKARGEKEDSSNPVLEMYTISNALSQSVKLAIWESSLNNFVMSIQRVTDDLRLGRKISMTKKQVLMKTGELFALRHLINLSSDLLDTPDFYWDRETLVPLYQTLCSYLNISRRTRVMNEKLNHCCELTELLNSQMNDKLSTRLEVMIVVLILVEVLFEIVHLLERHLLDKSPGDKGNRDHPEPVVVKGK